MGSHTGAFYRELPILDAARRCGLVLNNRTLEWEEVEASCPFCGDHGPGKCCGYALVGLNAANGVTYMRCRQRVENKSCPGPGTLTRHELEKSVYNEMVKKMREFQTLRGGKAEGYNPKLTAARAKLAKIESEIEKLIDTLTGANPLLLQYANSRIEELDAERQKQLKLVADLTANSVSTSQLDSISGYLKNWDEVSFDDKRRVVDTLISRIEATSTERIIHWKI